MRMIGIGLLGFLLAGTALLLSSMNILESGKDYVRALTSDPQLVFEHRTPASSQDTHTARLVRSNPDHPVILSGLPAYQSVAFIMPMDARPTSGYLQINATSQVLDGVEGALRISVRNTRRGEMLLRPGEVGRSLRIPLSPLDFAGDQLVVSFSLQGTGPQHQCSAEGGIEAIVEIETTSAIYLTLEHPMTSPGDIIRAGGHVAHVAWPNTLADQEQVRRLVLATQLKRGGVTTVFAAGQMEAALTTEDLRAARKVFPELPVQGDALGDKPLIAAGAGLRRFHHQAVWRERYEMQGAVAKPMPAQLDLHMKLGRMFGDDQWFLTVTLNNRLVYQTHVAGTQTEWHTLIDLPVQMHEAANVIDVVASSTAAQNGVCDRGPELVAELLPTSRLIMSGKAFADPLTAVRAALADVATIEISQLSKLNAVEADTASRMLDTVLPAGAAIKPGIGRAHVKVLRAQNAYETANQAGSNFLVTANGVGGDLTVTELQPGHTIEHVGLALLITPDATTLAEAEG